MNIRILRILTKINVGEIISDVDCHKQGCIRKYDLRNLLIGCPADLTDIYKISSF